MAKVDKTTGADKQVEKKARKKAAVVPVKGEKSKEERDSVLEVEQEKPKAKKRYDVLLVSERGGYKPSRSAIGTMVHQLAYRGFAAPVEEAIAEKWLEIYFEPSVSAHEVFWEKAYTSGEEVFEELVLRVEDKAFFAEYGDIKAPLYWSIEFRNCLFEEPLGHFKKLFLEALNLRLHVVSREHKGLPPHRVVAEDEVVVEKKRRERGAGLAGTHVEEL